MDQDQDWYEAIVINNELLGDAFLIDDTCVFRRIINRRIVNEDGRTTHQNSVFEVFNLKSEVKILTGEQAKTQLRSARDSKGNVVRARDQGYIDWKYTNVEI